MYAVLGPCTFKLSGSSSERDNKSSYKSKQPKTYLYIPEDSNLPTWCQEFPHLRKQVFALLCQLFPGWRCNCQVENLPKLIKKESYTGGINQVRNTRPGQCPWKHVPRLEGFPVQYFPPDLRPMHSLVFICQPFPQENPSETSVGSFLSRT